MAQKTRNATVTEPVRFHFTITLYEYINIRGNNYYLCTEVGARRSKENNHDIFHAQNTQTKKVKQPVNDAINVTGGLRG